MSGLFFVSVPIKSILRNIAVAKINCQVYNSRL